jgi:Type II restriction endonuclease EcoO109I
MASSGVDLLDDVIAPLSRVALVSDVRQTLGVSPGQARSIVHAFDLFVAQPLEANLERLSGRDLAKRNPMVYTIRGLDLVDEWIEHVLSDKETSALENYSGTFLEEVVRIVSGGVKPGSGVDLQLERPDGVIELYAIQTSSTTKNSGGRRTDVESLKRAARPLRAARRHVDLFVGVLVGRRRTSALRSEPDVVVLSSAAFWERMTGIPDFYARLLKSTLHLRTLVRARSADELSRIAAEARVLYGTEDGALNLDGMASPPSRAELVKLRQLRVGELP